MFHSSTQTTLCAASKLVVSAVKHQLSTPDDGRAPYWILYQMVEFTMHDGNKFALTVHLKEGCNALSMGEPIVMPEAPKLEGESA